MTQAEADSWREFYNQFPFDDFHRYLRPAALAATAQNSKNRGEAIKAALEWLQPKSSPNSTGWSDAELRSFAAHGVTPPPRK
ncbi:hypothetical protein [Lysobacter sp. Root96]|uniref:hypothetical protein n=1 Tax=Lysobacter sp. Root96 TaxID=1736612 RepID=UPI0012FBEE86|nr:hypothetical protein [Lysobacter sp. Root96]